MSGWIEIIAFAILVWLCLAILSKLNRLPRAATDSSFRPGFPDLWLIVETDNVLEEDFRIDYIDDWSVGRPFSAYGKPTLCDNWPEDLKPSSRVGIKIRPSAEWFSTSQIGHVHSYGEGGLSVSILLPYQLARHVLEDLRRNPRLRPSINFKKISTPNGDRYAVYGFELLDPDR